MTFGVGHDNRLYQEVVHSRIPTRHESFWAWLFRCPTITSTWQMVEETYTVMDLSSECRWCGDACSQRDAPVCEDCWVLDKMDPAALRRKLRSRGR